MANKLNNKRYTEKIPVFILISQETRRSYPGLNKMILDRRREGNEELGDEISKTVIESKEIAALEKQWGVKIWEDLDVSITPADLLYQIWGTHTPVPTAPLALRLRENRASEVAKILEPSQEEIDVPNDVAEQARDVLASNSKWEATPFLFTAKGGGEETALPLTHEIFKKAFKGLLSGLMDDMVKWTAED